MVCVCGHNKSSHEYQRDTQKHVGKCNAGYFENDAKPCVVYCNGYKKQIKEGVTE